MLQPPRASVTAVFRASLRATAPRVPTQRKAYISKMAMNSGQIDLSLLSARVAEQFDKAIAAGDAFFYESESR